MTILNRRFSELLELLPKFQENSASQIEAAASVITETFISGNKLLICGNGGSAADSQHFAAEFVNTFSKSINRRGLPAIALTTDTSILTAISNDSTFDNVYSRQVQSYGVEKDLLIAFTTSGNSRNCLNAVKIAKESGLQTIAFTRTQAEISNLVDIAIEVPSLNTQHIQECHILSYHIITELVEMKLFKEQHE
jgi:D-sedoheptulose 7-phosphate isomerase